MVVFIWPQVQLCGLIVNISSRSITDEIASAAWKRLGVGSTGALHSRRSHSPRRLQFRESAGQAGEVGFQRRLHLRELCRVLRLLREVDLFAGVGGEVVELVGVEVGGLPQRGRASKARAHGAPNHRLSRGDRE